MKDSKGKEVKEGTHKCYHCGKKKWCMFVPDPYQHDLYGDTTKYWLCDECHDQLCADI